MHSLPSTLSVIMITKNEESKLRFALASVKFATEIIIVDSGSTDSTCDIAREFGATVIQSENWPGFGPQKNFALSYAKSEWIFSIDADEYVTPELASQIQAVIHSPKPSKNSDGYLIKRQSIFIDQRMQFGDWSHDQVLRLFRREVSRFSDDLVHERVITSGSISELKGVLMHTPVKRLEDATRKMWRYNITASTRLVSSKKLRFYDPWSHSSWSFFRGLILRLGILDGYRGVQLAWFNAKGTFIRYERAYRRQQLPRKRVGVRRLKAYLNLLLLDHGFLRVLYDNGAIIAGAMYRVNQPSPSRLRSYKRKYGIKSVINLRGSNPQLGWYQLESDTCEELSVQLYNIQVHSRGLPTCERVNELRRLIERIELPALAHCKSGADRTGIFSVLYRHFRLGESIEVARDELSLRFGHFRGARTGILDYFFEQYLIQRKDGQSFIDWVNSDYDQEKLESGFRARGFMTFIVDKIFLRE